VKYLIKVGLIGFGRWGHNLAKTFTNIPNCKLTAICDSSEAKLHEAINSYGSISTFSNRDDFFKSADIDAVAIATPAVTHFELTYQALKYNLHCFVEKPFTLSYRDAKYLKLNKPDDLTCMVDYTYLYHPGIQKLGELISEFGKPKFISILFSNFEPFRVDLSAFNDWMPHPTSILLSFFKQLRPGGCIEIDQKTALATFFDKNSFFHVTVSYEMMKQRIINVIYDKQAILFDEINLPREKCIKFFGIEKSSQIDPTPPLTVSCSHFIDCIQNDLEPLTNFKFAAKVVKIINSLRG